CKTLKKRGHSMKSYWLWMLLNLIVWPFAIAYLKLPINELPAYIFGIAFYFLLFFLVPLFQRKLNLLMFILCTNTIIATAVLFPYKHEFNSFLVLIISLLIAEGFYRLPLRYSIGNGLLGIIGLEICAFASNLSFFLQTLLAVFILFFFIALIHYKKIQDQLIDLDARYEAILSEF